MKSIAFVTPGYDPRDIRRGSGTFFYLAKELGRQGCTIHYVGPLIVKDPLLTRFFRMITRVVFRKPYSTYLDPWFASARCKTLAKQLANVKYDIILTNDHGIAARNITGKPVVVYTDVMLPLNPSNRKFGKLMPLSGMPYPTTIFFQSTIKKSLNDASICVFPAEWQIRDAKRYGVSPTKLCLIPFGANVPDPGQSIAKNGNYDKSIQNGRLEILFVGRDWSRKGGEMAIKITTCLREVGIDATLHVVGAELTNMPAYVCSYGLLDKNDREDWALLDRLYRECQVFLFPSLSEGSVIAPREASAYGLPTIAYRIDGVVGAVEDGINGILLDIDSDADAFVRVIQYWLNNPLEYERLVISSRYFYETNANWSSSVAKLITKIDELFDDK